MSKGFGDQIIIFKGIVRSEKRSDTLPVFRDTNLLRGPGSPGFLQSLRPLDTIKKLKKGESVPHFDPIAIHLQEAENFSNEEKKI